MSYGSSNPFDITKATDFTDQQIKDYWVDMPGGCSLRDLAKPRSAMPMLILGGKGSGKTHLMRYFSYQIQKIMHGEDTLDGIRSDGFVGIYLRCGGLNTLRFAGKGQQDDVWSRIYAYYMDLWLSRLVLGIVSDLYKDNPELAEAEQAIFHDVAALVELGDLDVEHSVAGILQCFTMLQAEADTEINNCSSTRHLDITVRATPGNLVFGIPRILIQHLPSLVDVVFLYLIDEFENLSEDQQRYVNTLVREKHPPASIKVGSRLYGVKTSATYSDNEENKEGSEFECLRLDDQLRKNLKQYRCFARELVARRLLESGYAPCKCRDQKSIAHALSSSFETLDSSDYSRRETEFVVAAYQNRERPYFEHLRSQLRDGIRADAARGVVEDDLPRVIGNLSCYDYPLLEKVNILRLYKDWYSGKDLLVSSELIRESCERFLRVGRLENSYWTVLDHFRSDLLAQLRRQCMQKQVYCGIDAFIDMSQGLPRNLLVTLKEVFKWAVFNGEQPFKDKPISISAQREGLKEASEWFFRDARAPGGEGNAIRDGIERLATLFREARFSDKPSECSLTAFSGDQSGASEKTRSLIDSARKWSLLIYVGEQSHRNSMRKDPKYQLNPMLAPRWDLPIARRGVIDLSPAEMNAIFDPQDAPAFTQILRTRRSRMSAPLWGKARPARPRANEGLELFGGADDV